MKGYLEERNQKVIDMINKMRVLRDQERKNNGPNVDLFAEVISELEYRTAKGPDFGSLRLCPSCESPISKKSYNNYCEFCGQLIRK